MRRQFVLDKRTDELLENLAMEGGGNRSVIVRAAIQHFADLQVDLERIENDPEFQKMMAGSDKAIREGRTVSHQEVVRMSRAQTGKKKK